MSNKSSSWERCFRYSFNRGFGKSLIFQPFLRLAKAAMKSEMCSIVVSPLVSVTRDQVLGFSAAAIGLSEEYEEDEKAAREEKCVFFFFASPETWLSTAIKPLENGITRCRVNLVGRQRAFAVDEGK